MDCKSEIIDYVTIRPDGLLITYEKVGIPSKKNYILNEKHDITEECNKVKGVLSDQSMVKLRRAINLLIAISKEQKINQPWRNKQLKFKINFITLTLSAQQDKETDYQIKSKLLNHFLTILRQYHGLKSYVWKAETQKNGNLHFHITTNLYLDYQVVRDLWNNCQKKLGYIDLFNEKHSHIDPNSTDIHAVSHVKNIAAYMIKEMCKKQDDRRDIDGKIWDCSRNLKTKYTAQLLAVNEDKSILRNILNTYKHNIYNHDYYTFISMSSKQMDLSLPQEWKVLYSDYIESVRIKT